MMNFLSLFRRGGFACSNGPNRFIGNDKIFSIGQSLIIKTLMELIGYNSKSLICFSFSESFSYTINNFQTFFQGSFDFGIKFLRSFSKVLATLRVPKNHKGSSKIF